MNLGVREKNEKGEGKKGKMTLKKGEKALQMYLFRQTYLSGEKMNLRIHPVKRAVLLVRYYILVILEEEFKNQIFSEILKIENVWIRILGPW